MKKIALITIAIFMIVGCEKNNKIENNNQNQNNNIYVEINDEKFRLGRETNLKNMYYKENYVDFYTDAIGNARIIQYSKEGKFVFEVRLIYEDKKTFEEVKKLVKYESKTKKMNDIEYTYYEYKNENNDNIHLYLYNYQNITYSIMFICRTDIEDYEKKFMENVKFE